VTAEDEAERAADEATLREVQAELELSRQRVPITCECDDASCHAPILLGDEEYELVHSDGTCVVIVTGHSMDGEILEESEGHTIVHKTGLGAELSQELGPRS
jgi:hypothetical protein